MTPIYDYYSVVINYGDVESFNSMLKDGWEPIRETPSHPSMGNSNNVNYGEWLCILRREKKS